MPRLFRRLLSATLALLLALAAIAAALLLAGQYAMVTTHGVSMNPVYHQGDLVVVQRESAYAAGDIVAYRRPGKDAVVLHRIIGGSPTGWTFKGDNNQSVDPTTPTQSQLIGRAALHIPYGGTWLRRLTAPPLLAAYAFLLLLGGTAATRTRRQKRKDRRTMSPRHLARPCSTLGSLPAPLCTVAAGAAVLGVLGAALSGLAWTRPTDHVVEAASSTTSSMRFSYVAQVPRSAAYDGTTVTAPLPVFRKLTNDVDVTYRYAGLPGTLTLTVELSTAGGWRTTIPISKGTVGRTYDGTAHLDLAALQRRADAAATTTGIPAGVVSVAVLPHIGLAGGGSFAPRFELSLTPLVLKPTSERAATASVESSGSRVEPAQIAAFGRAVAVSTARTAGVLILLMSLLAAAVVTAIARMTGPVAEAERVRARYGDLILPVLPIALVAGRPVVDVPAIDSLARLAERYGLLVLHWGRGGVDTYVVQDESVTYRYRAGGAAVGANEPAGQPVEA